MQLKEYTTSNGEVLLYTGLPDFNKLEKLSEGPGDLWHSSLDQGFSGIFPEIVYQTVVFWWYLNDLSNLKISVNWRINPYAFVVRKEVWLYFKGFDKDYETEVMKALDLGYRMLRYGGAVPLYIKDLFPKKHFKTDFSGKDRYIFYLKNFKNRHSWFMFVRESIKKPLQEFKYFRSAKEGEILKHKFFQFPARPLEELVGKPTVDIIIPTMFRQEFTSQLLQDYENQSYLPSRIIVIDATPVEEEVESIYTEDYPFELIVKHQSSKGSCRARNEAIVLSKSDYIIFADDDTRILPDFIENHLRFLQTYKVDACTGLDIHAAHYHQDLDDLRKILEVKGIERFKAGAAQTFNNANSCVKRERVLEIAGNDINFDGGYGEDADFGYRLIKLGVILMFNPYSVNLHLKPPSGGYRYWGNQSIIVGKNRKIQPWELDKPVGKIRPVPSPTIVYGIIKHYKSSQVREYKYRYLFLYLTRNITKLPIRLLKIPFKLYQFNKSVFYAENLLKRGERFK